MLKSLWDMITLVKSSFDDWNTTLWSDINVEQMETDCKKFVKVLLKVTRMYRCVRTLQKSMKACMNLEV